jgi:hypothetical protein
MTMQDQAMHDQAMPGAYDQRETTDTATSPVVTEETLNGDTAMPAEAEGAENPTEATKAPASTEAEMLFAQDELADMRARWANIQAVFVDDPRECVHKVDGLVSDLVEQLTTGFAHARSRLEEQWSRDEEASTEDLRVALMHYREFFERLLSV